MAKYVELYAGVRTGALENKRGPTGRWLTDCKYASASLFITRGPDFRANGIVVVRRRYDRIYSWLAQMQMKLFRPIGEKWCHYRPIDERDVIIRLHLSFFGTDANENSAIGRPSCTRCLVLCF